MALNIAAPFGCGEDAAVRNKIVQETLFPAGYL
ncbi:hypothetical protein X737_24525 [Mesorhizobium sp. L48C026A00]|nr:hypothetical protein X737_24525 [Mesorhizobium sp. L48C026A00]